MENRETLAGFQSVCPFCDTAGAVLDGAART